MKEVLPSGALIKTEAKEAIRVYATEFISFVTCLYYLKLIMRIELRKNVRQKGGRNCQEKMCYMRFML